MFKFLACSLLYSAALLFVYAGFAIAPGMQWPVSQADYLAASLLSLGMIAKFCGHVILLARFK